MTWPNPGKIIAQVWTALLAAAPVKVWAQVGAAMVNTVVLVGFGLVIWLGPWLEIHQAIQLDWLGYGMTMAAFLSLVSLAAITGLSVNVHGGKDGLTASIDQDEAQPITVTTKTETTVTPAAAELPVPDADKPPWERRP